MILDPVSNPDISQDDVYIVNSTIPVENLLGGNPDDVRYFIFANDSVFKSNTNLKLQAGVDFQGKVGDTLVLLFDGDEWLEISRSLNPLYAGGSLNDYTLDSGYILTEINNLRNQIASIQHDLDIIGPTFVNTTVHINPSMSVSDIQTEIDRVRPHICNGATVEFVFENGVYTFSDTLKFRNFMGDGIIKIRSITPASNAQPDYNVQINSYSSEKPFFLFINNDIEFQVSGIEGSYAISSTPNEYELGGVTIVNSKNINFKYCSVKSRYDNANDINFYYKNSTGEISDCYVSHGKSGITANRLSKILIANCYSVSGALPDYGISSLNGSEINLLDNTYPNGSTDDTLTENSGRIYS